MRGVSWRPRPCRVLPKTVDLVPLFLLTTALGCTGWITGCASLATQSAAANPASLSIVPSNIDFHEVVVGQKNTQTVEITNNAGVPISFEVLRISGQGFTFAAPKTPFTLPAGRSFPVSLAFSPCAATAASGALLLSSSDFPAPFRVPLSGTGEKAAPALQATPSALNFGSTPLQTPVTQMAALKNTGNVPIAISSLAVSNSAYSVSGLAAGTTLLPEQAIQFPLAFRPSTVGTTTATLSVASASLTAPVKLSLSGSGISSMSSSLPSAPSSTTHFIALAWNASPSPIAGYHVYRGTASGGPYARISSALIGGLDFNDAAVESGARYFYVVTAVDSAGDESPFSNEAAAVIP